MQPIEVFNALLTGAASVTALTGTRIYPLELPQGTQPSAIAIDVEFDDALPTIDAASAYGMRRAQVVLHLIARDLAALYSLASAVDAACQYQRGTIAGVNVTSIGPGDRGSPEIESAVPLAYLPVRFPLIYRR